MMYKKILLPTDGSKCAGKAAKHAILLASQNNAELIVLNVLETRSLAGLPVEEFNRKINEIFRQEGIHALEQISKMHKDLSREKDIRSFKLTLKTEEGHPADMILLTAEKENVDLVVIGASGKHSVERFILGSIAEKVVRHAKCPVLTVH
ncbi:universal stress protein [Methanobacterium sp.]|jgi:nucleotide-binding universal stress UspA family protein|uniref:universal stress protein n=1 Tax=Methanobacterium sp. TaxID=2164 RepID=UPI00338F0925